MFFVGKGYCDQKLFVLNIYEIVNESTSSFAYLIDLYDIWHARQEHLNSSYAFKLKNLGIIKLHDKQTRKCEICVESKITKKTCYPVQRQYEPLGLIHTNLVDLKQHVTRGGKSYLVTFIDDFSRYTKIYLVRNKNKAFNMFLIYKVEVENQLNKKIKRVRSDRGGEYTLFKDFSKNEGITHEVILPHSPSQTE